MSAVCSEVKGVVAPAEFEERPSLGERKCRMGHKIYLQARTTTCSTAFTFIGLMNTAELKQFPGMCYDELPAVFLAVQTKSF